MVQSKGFTPKRLKSRGTSRRSHAAGEALALQLRASTSGVVDTSPCARILSLPVMAVGVQFVPLGTSSPQDGSGPDVDRGAVFL